MPTLRSCSHLVATDEKCIVLEWKLKQSQPFLTDKSRKKNRASKITCFLLLVTCSSRCHLQTKKVWCHSYTVFVQVKQAAGKREKVWENSNWTHQKWVLAVLNGINPWISNQDLTSSYNINTLTIYRYKQIFTDTNAQVKSRKLSD